MRVTLNEESQPRFQYEFRGGQLREGDVVDGVWRSQFVYDAVVVRPDCFNVRRPYRAGDWAI
jgi:hypothetical protein